MSKRGTHLSISFLRKKTSETNQPPLTPSLSLHFFEFLFYFADKEMKSVGGITMVYMGRTGLDF